jgi:hypothetical protein
MITLQFDGEGRLQRVTKVIQMQHQSNLFILSIACLCLVLGATGCAGEEVEKQNMFISASCEPPDNGCSPGFSCVESPSLGEGFWCVRTGSLTDQDTSDTSGAMLDTSGAMLDTSGAVFDTSGAVFDTNPPGPGLCQTRGNLFFLSSVVESGRYAGQVGKEAATSSAASCGLANIASENPQEATTECMLAEPNNIALSRDCAGCFAEEIFCSIMFCVAKCAADPSADICTECRREQGCTATFDACTGFID